jgi:hypothetical protein
MDLVRPRIPLYKGQLHRHTCSVIGNRHMVSIGGGETLQSNFWAEARRPDPVFDNSIGIFDLSEMTWVEVFNQSVAPYVRPKALDAWYTSK